MDYEIHIMWNLGTDTQCKFTNNEMNVMKCNLSV